MKSKPCKCRACKGDIGKSHLSHTDLKRIEELRIKYRKDREKNRKYWEKKKGKFIGDDSDKQKMA